MKWFTRQGIGLEEGDAFDASMLNLLGNMTLFMPLGFLIPILRKRCRTLRKVLVIGIAVSGFIEIVQYFIGSTDIDDVILNVLGWIIGFAVHKFIVNMVNHQKIN